MINHKKENYFMNNKFLMIAIFVAVAAGAYWYTTNTSAQPAMEKKETVTQSASGSAMSNDSVAEFTVEGSEFKFVANEMKLKKGQKVKLTFKNTGDMPHDFVIDELNVRTKVIKGGETDVVEFTPETTGTFESYCSVGSHRAKGMVGKVIVE